MPARNGMERWRGETTEALRSLKDAAAEHKEELRALGDRFEAALTKHVAEDKSDFAAVNEKVATLTKSHAAMRGKVAGVSALIGAVVAAGLQAAMEKLFH